VIDLLFFKEIIMEEEKESVEETRENDKAGSSEPKKKSKKMIVAIVIILVVLGILAFALRSLYLAAAVDGSFISRFAVISELEKENGKAALETLITRKLISEEASNRGIEVTQDEVNGEIAQIEQQLSSQGVSLETALSEQGMTREDLTDQIEMNKMIEKMVEAVEVTDEEVDRYFTDNQIEVPEEEKEAARGQIREMLKSQKLSEAAANFVDTLRASANIRYFAGYAK